jgi:uridine phosphorylase
MRRQVLRLVGATAALWSVLLLGTSLVASAASADSGAGTAVNPADARAAAAKSAGFRAAAGVGHAAVTWQSGSIVVGGSEYWTWHNTPANAIFEVSLAPHDVEQHRTCFLRVARTWYVNLCR